MAIRINELLALQVNYMSDVFYGGGRKKKLYGFFPSKKAVDECWEVVHSQPCTHAHPKVLFVDSFRGVLPLRCACSCVRLITSCTHVRSLVLAMRSHSGFILLMQPGLVLAMCLYACADASCSQHMALSGFQRWLSALALSASSQRMASARGFSACLSALALIAWLS